MPPSGSILKHKFSKPEAEIPKQVRDDKKTRTSPTCHAELVSASGLLFLLSADTPFIPVHRTGFSGAISTKMSRMLSAIAVLSILSLGFVGGSQAKSMVATSTLSMMPLHFPNLGTERRNWGGYRLARW